MEDVRCYDCGRKLAVADFKEIQIKCPRCKALNHHVKATEPLDGSPGGNNGKPNHSMDRRQA